MLNLWIVSWERARSIASRRSLLQQFLSQGIVNLAIAGRGDNPPLLHLDDVPAEFVLDRRLRDLAGLQGEGDIGKAGPDLIAAEEAKIAAVLTVRVLAELPRQGREIGTLVQIRDQLLRLLFGGNQDVAGMGFLG